MAETPTTPTWEDIQKYLGEIQGGGEETQLELMRMGIENTDKWNTIGREDLLKSKQEAIDKYQPFREGGQYWLQQAKDQILGGAPKYTAPAPFEYADYKGQDPFKFDSKYTPQTWDEFAKTRLGPENIKSSPFYDLYQWQNQQQQEGIDKGLRARGMYGSGAGMTDALKAKTGLEQQFAADEYGRGLQDYQMTEQQKIAKDSSDYGRAAQQYGMTEDQIRNAYGTNSKMALQKYGLNVLDPSDKAFKIAQGQWTDKLNTNLGLGDYAWKAATGQANAGLNVGSQLGTNAIQTGNTQAGLINNAGSNIGAGYNAYGNQLGSAFGNTLNYGLGLQGLNQGQSNWNAANNANLGLGIGTIGAGILNRYLTPTKADTPSSYDPNINYYWGSGGGVDANNYDNILDPSYGGQYGL